MTAPRTSGTTTGGRGERVRPLRPEATAGTGGGDFDDGTTHKRDYDAKQGERARPFRPNSDIGAESGDFDDGTTHKRDYDAKQGERARPIRPESQVRGLKFVDV